LNASVHRVTPEGATLSRWVLDTPADEVNQLALSPLDGGRLIVTDSRYVTVYDSKTGINEFFHDIYLNIYVPHNFKFAVEAMGCEHMVKFGLFLCHTTTTQGICAIDDRRMLLVLHDWHLKVHKMENNEQVENWPEISIKSGIVRRGFHPRHHWYDEGRGLILSPRNASLMALRITH